MMSPTKPETSDFWVCPDCGSGLYGFRVEKAKETHRETCNADKIH